MAQEEKVSKFLEAITKDALRRKEKILKDIDDFNKEELEKAEDEALSEAYTLIQGEIANTRSELRREFCLMEMEKRKELFTKRAQITEQIFQRAFDALKDYTATEAYRRAFLTDLKDAASLFGDDPVEVTIRQEDLALQPQIQAAFSGGCTVKAKEELHIGGFQAKDSTRGLLADYTLDTKLAQQKDWFLENSGLSIDN